MRSVHVNTQSVVNIEAWANARNIIKGATAKDQFFKLVSEMGEVVEGTESRNREEIKDGVGDSFVVLTIMARQLGVSILDAIDGTTLMSHTDIGIHAIKGQLADALAKGQTTMAIGLLGVMARSLWALAARYWLEFNECVDAAYESIKDRKGVMYNGVFIKSDDARYASALEELSLQA